MRQRFAARGATATNLVLLAVIVMLGVGMAVVWRASLRSGEMDAARTLQQTIGLTSPVKNRLDARFTDADNDLVADAPTDPAAFVDPDELTFSYVAIDDPSEFQAAFADFLKYLSTKTGKRVTYLPVTSTEEQLQALRDGRLHVTGLNTGSVPRAVNVCGFVPVCAMGGTEGAQRYQMEIIVPAGSAITAVQDLKGHELTLTDPGSNSGYKAPLVLLNSDFGLKPGDDFLIRNSGGHDESIKGIAAGTYQAAAVANDVLRRATASGLITAAQFRSIYKSESFPTAGLGYAHNLKPELTAKIRDAFATFDWKGTGVERQFAGTGQTRFVTINYKNDFALVRRIDDAVGLAYRLSDTPTTKAASRPADGN